MRIYGNQTVINGNNMAARFSSNFDRMLPIDRNDRDRLAIYYPPSPNFPQTGVRALNLFEVEDDFDGVEALHPGSMSSDGADPTMLAVLIGVYAGVCVCVLACISLCVCVCVCTCVWPIIKLHYLW